MTHKSRIQRSFILCPLLALSFPALGQPFSGAELEDAVKCYGIAVNAHQYYQHRVKPTRPQEADRQMVRFEKVAKAAAAEVLHSGTVAGREAAAASDLRASGASQADQLRDAAARGALDSYFKKLIKQANGCAARWSEPRRR